MIHGHPLPVHPLLPHQTRVVSLVIAVAAGSLAAWLAVTARVKAALISAAHARTAMREMNTKLRDAQREIAQLRHQVARLIAENESLSGALTLKRKHEDAEWEAEQQRLEEALRGVDGRRARPVTGGLRDRIRFRQKRSVEGHARDNSRQTRD